MESWWLNVLEKNRHTLYRDSVTLIQGHVFSVLLMFLFSKTILLLLLWQAERAMEEEVESWPWRGCSGLQRRVSIYAAGMRVCQRELKEERQILCRSRSLTPFLSSTRLKEGGIRPTKCYSSGAHDLPFPLNAGCYPRVQALPTWTGSFVLSWLRAITTFWDRTEAKFSSLLLSFRSKYAAAFW